MGAYSDGNHLYLNGFHFDIQFWYCKVLDEGGLLLFKGAMNNNDAAVVAEVGGAIVAAAVSSSERLYVLDLRTMETQRVKKEDMSAYLSEYPEIIADYENESKKFNSDLQLRYLRKINGGIDGSKLLVNSSYDIEMDNVKPFCLVLYRRHKNELDTAVRVFIKETSFYNAIPDSYWWKKYSTADSTLNICWMSNGKS
jgi:hypothetical protein